MTPARLVHVTSYTSVTTVQQLRTSAQTCERQAELPTLRAGLNASQLRHTSGAFRTWAAHLWRQRLSSCRVVLAHTLPLTHDWETAVAIVQRAYPGTSPWLLGCSSSEGGHGIWVWNGGQPASSSSHGSGAGGWMQYMAGTFDGDYGDAVADLHSRGWRVPRDADSWYSPLGQAIAAGWAAGHNRPSGKWLGAGC